MSNQSSDSLDLYVAQLAFIGASIATLGDGLSALAAGIALNELQKSNNANATAQFDQSKEMESLQQQIDYLIGELRQIKKMLR